ncbi:NAD(P)H:quinone oxidoreductase [Telmatospirillum sp. J64-1]|uniref:NAD(P)H:quinone oxidoreductase n=1 Tax=Telmatospirillum sp. J64-1 TaxID=2502183 RepID=UPI00115E47F5|nr:NAD(P)H:quinone oxidoreductase [Telmatospirillum sp. J64-1]
MAKILVLYYSGWGHIEQMAKAACEGVREAGGEAVLKRVPELVPEDVAKQSYMKLDQDAPIASPNELADYDGFLIGSPTRFGNMAAQMRNFLDQTGGLWAKGALVGKPAGAFTSTASQHGGQETTLTSMHTTFLHHGMVVVGLPYTTPDLTNLDEVSGGTPYGASTLAAGDGSRQPSEAELRMMRFQAAHLTRIADKLKG